MGDVTPRRPGEVLPPEETLPAKQTSLIKVEDYSDLAGLLIPTSIVVEQDSNVTPEYRIGRLDAAGIYGGQTTTEMTVEGIFVPKDGYVGPEFYDFDHLPILKAVLPLYKWVVVEVTAESIYASHEMNPINPDRRRRRGILVNMEQRVTARFHGVAHDTDRQLDDPRHQGR
jgi:hypothetical protein